MTRTLSTCTLALGLALIGPTATSAAGPPPAVPSTAPEASSLDSVSLQTRSGEPATGVFENDGKPTFVIVWASWVAPGTSLVDSVMKDFQEAWAKELGVKVVVISTDEAKSLSMVDQKVKQKGWTFPIHFDPSQSVMKALELKGLPHVFIVGADGTVVWQRSGFRPGDSAALREMDEAVRESASG